MRKRRRIIEIAAEWAYYSISAVVVAAALLSLTVAVVILAGCTTLTYDQQRELQAAARGCYCEGTGCRKITAAAGKAAMAAAESESAAKTEVRR